MLGSQRGHGPRERPKGTEGESGNYGGGAGRALQAGARHESRPRGGTLCAVSGDRGVSGRGEQVGPWAGRTGGSGRTSSEALFSGRTDSSVLTAVESGVFCFLFSCKV